MRLIRLGLLVVLMGCGLVRAAEAPASFAPPMDVLYENRLQAESSAYLSINLFNISIDAAKAARPELFTISSPDDPDYAAAQQVHPRASGSRTRAVRVSLRKELLVKGTCIFLQLPRPMKRGKTYAVTVGDIGGKVPELAAVLFEDTKRINDNIRLNQLGYLPGFAKRAYLGQYMGDLGPMPFDGLAFELMDEQGHSVFHGKVAPRGVHDELVGQRVYEMDFSAVDAPGAYRIHVEGVGLSYPFRIGPGALNPAYANLMFGQYHQRCGMEIDPAYSRHARPACHLDDAYIDAESEKTPFTHPKAPPFYPTHFDGRRQKAIHGHHDAGDYGKYTITGAAYVFSALNAMEVFPDKFREDNLGLPYSGNGVPDLVEECKWELDWLENMQDASDGGVFGVIKPRSGGYENSMPQPEAHRLFFPKDTVFTAAYAGALAHASRSAVLRKYYAADCDRYLQKAIKAWGFLEKNHRYVEYFHYGAEFGDWDERCWAAEELYAATGQATYHDYFLKNFDPGKKRWTWWPLFEACGYATTSYAFLNDRPRDAAMLQRCRDEIRQACRMHMRDSDNAPYRLSMPEPTIQHGNYGWVFPGDMAGYDLLMGYALDKDKAYLQCALDNLSYTCGANPSGYFLQTGLGAKRNIEVVSNVANADGIIEPIPGIPLGIGSAEFYWLNLYQKRIAEGTYPAKWPLMNRWYDGFNVSSEFTMGPMMRETIVAAFFADMGQAAHARPTVRITNKATTGAAPLAVQFEIQTESLDAPIVETFWDFGDESFSTQRAPRHVFTIAGKTYPVAVTVVDANGLRGYALAAVNCTVATAAYPRQEFPADGRTLALYHFNGDLKDASGHGLDLKAEGKRAGEKRPFAFSPQPPMWMGQPAGSCLVLDGAEQFKVTIPATVLHDAAGTPLSMEMMLYLQEFAGWGYDGNPVLLGLQNDWDSLLGWKQETWEKAGGPMFGKAIEPARFVKDFPRERWCQVKITWDGKGKAMFFVDGKAWGTIDGPTLKPGVAAPLTFSIGPFKGMVDEVRLRTGKD